jgi:hypothetical protein
MEVDRIVPEPSSLPQLIELNPLNLVCLHPLSNQAMSAEILTAFAAFCTVGSCLRQGRTERVALGYDTNAARQECHSGS